ncbi:hypothetical protein QUF80_01530 [Desulfococcaceae bacterium HSG8]|nr:hypothetical protein [Desulfococcaceae bacterium HSG8]
MENSEFKTRKINDILEDFMGIPESKPMHSNPLKSLVLTILSQNTSDVNSFNAFRSLEKAYRGTDGETDWHKLVEAPASELADVIRSGGLANQKSERIQNILQWLKREYGDYNADFICNMDQDKAIKLFTGHKGIGVKTVSVVLAFSCGTDIFPVDTHVNRICHRLGLVSRKYNAEKTFWAMQDLVPEGKSFSLHVNMIRLGRQICHSRNPKCRQCPLEDECEFLLAGFSQ